MWREKILEAKKAKGITSKMMSEKTRVPETTIKRILAGKTETPRIDTVLEMGEAVGLSPWELFSESVSVLGDKTMAALQEELDLTKSELAALQAVYASLSDELSQLKFKNLALTSKVEMLQAQVDLKDEIIAIHNFYLNRKPGE